MRALLLSALVLSGCTVITGQLPCELDDQCPAAERCLAGLCAPAPTERDPEGEIDELSSPGPGSDIVVETTEPVVGAVLTTRFPENAEVFVALMQGAELLVVVTRDGIPWVGLEPVFTGDGVRTDLFPPEEVKPGIYRQPLFAVVNPTYAVGFLQGPDQVGSVELSVSEAVQFPGVLLDAPGGAEVVRGEPVELQIFIEDGTDQLELLAFGADDNLLYLWDSLTPQSGPHTLDTQRVSLGRVILELRASRTYPRLQLTAADWLELSVR